MRTLLKLVGALALVTAPALAQTKDRVSIGLRLEPPGLDPTTQAAAVIGEITWLNIYEGLTRVDEKGTVLPSLAESWTVSDDGKTYTFKLISGVKFHDGSAFDSADVKFTFERNGAPSSTNKRKRVFANMASIETPDPATVKITLKEPSRLLPYFLSEATGAILAPETAEKNGVNPIGTGPYKFVRWARGDSITMEKFTGHRKAADTAINRAVIRFITDDNAAIAALLAGDLDYLPLLGALEAVDRFKADARFQVLVGATEGETLLAINNKRKPFDDVRVRQALNHAVDRRAVIDGASNGFGKPIASHLTTASPYYVDLTSRYPYDPAKAKKLLAEAGYPKGFEAAFKLPPQSYARRSGEIIAAQLLEVGINAKMEPIEWAQWLDVVFKQKNYGLTVIMQPEPWDIFNYANADYFYQYDNAQMGEMLKAIEASSSEADLKAKVEAAQRKLTEDAVNVWLYEFPKVSIARKELAGLWTDAPQALYEIAAMKWTK